VLTILNGGGDPGFKEEGPPSKVAAPNSDADAGVIFDIARAAHDEIALFVRDRYRRHDLARLVEAVLQADGFQTHRLALGPDGGADFLAGKGSLGLDLPTLCVQVRATEAPADVHIFRALQGTMATFGAQHGLLACWGGFTTFLKSEARQHSFEIRLWDQSDILQAVYGTYERLPEEIQAELPLKRIWALVREETEIEG